MPQIFKIGPYTIYFWSNENDPLVGPLWEHQLFLLSASIHLKGVEFNQGRNRHRRRGIIRVCALLRDQKVPKSFWLRNFFLLLDKAGAGCYPKSRKSAVASG